MQELREGLESSDYYIISSLSVVGSVETDWRYISSAFCGMGLYNLITETAAANLNSFLQH